MLGLLVGLLTAGLGLVPASAQEAAEGSTSHGSTSGTTASEDESRPPAGQTVVFGIPGLTINDIDRERTPNLYRLLSEGAAANLNVRTIGSATCPASGWLSFGAGARAQAGPSPAAEDADPDDPARCPTMIAPTTDGSADAEDGATSAKEAAKSDEAHDGDSVDGTTRAQIEGFDAVKEPNIGSGYSVDYGMLARTVAAAGDDVPAGTDAADADSLLEPCVAAEGPGAAYATANEDGVVTNFTDDATATDCRLGVVDLGAIGIRSWLYDPIPNYSYTVPPDFDRETRVA